MSAPAGSGARGGGSPRGTAPTEPGYGDALSRPYWAAAAEGRLVVQRCEACGAHQFYPRPFCLACQEEVEWVETSGRGEIYSLTINHLKLDPELQPPYYVALVRLEEGPVLLTRIVDAAGEPMSAGATIGDPVVVAWHPRADAPPLPVFTLRRG